MNSRPSQRQIDAFIEIVKQGSLVAAARKLGFTQPALSRRLAELEAQLGVRLMDRSRSGVTLTSEGEVFLRYASASAAALDQGLVQISRSRKMRRQSVRVGGLPTVAMRILAVAAQQFKQAHRDVPVTIIAGTNQTLISEMLKGDLDFMVGRLATPESLAGLQFEPLYREDLVAVVPPGHPLLTYRDPDEIGARINDHPVVLPMPDAPIRPDAERLLIAIGCLEVEDILETRSIEFGRVFTEQAAAVWITPRGAVAADIETGRLCLLPLETSATLGTVGITSRRGIRLSPLARELAGIIRSICRDK